jgi:hypothetical protein
VFLLIVEVESVYLAGIIGTVLKWYGWCRLNITLYEPLSYSYNPHWYKILKFLVLTEIWKKKLRHIYVGKVCLNWPAHDLLIGGHSGKYIPLSSR